MQLSALQRRLRWSVIHRFEQPQTAEVVEVEPIMKVRSVTAEIGRQFSSASYAAVRF